MIATKATQRVGAGVDRCQKAIDMTATKATQRDSAGVGCVAWLCCDMIATKATQRVGAGVGCVAWLCWWQLEACLNPISRSLHQFKFRYTRYTRYTRRRQ